MTCCLAFCIVSRKHEPIKSDRLYLGNPESVRRGSPALFWFVLQGISQPSSDLETMPPAELNVYLNVHLLSLLEFVMDI